MILIVGASGRLGGIVARRLLADGKPVRAMSRTPANLSELQELGAEIVAGDQRDPQSLSAACKGIDAVFTASHAFTGKGDNDSRDVDDMGNRNLIDAARAAGVQLVVYTSILGARSNHPVDMYRYKYATELYLRGSGIDCTILRPAPFMETWLEILGDSVVKRGTAMVFGKGTNSINFVSVEDVASIAVRALEDRQGLGRAVEVGGPENMSQLQFVRAIQQAAGRTVKIRHIPLPMMRVMRVATQRINPAFSRMTLAGIIMDTENMTLDPADMLDLFPMHLTSLNEVLARRFSAMSASQPLAPEHTL
jgi:uncharacterized protein YbjT (DUF2867 family)